jgi:protein TonB
VARALPAALPSTVAAAVTAPSGVAIPTSPIATTGPSEIRPAPVAAVAAPRPGSPFGDMNGYLGFVRERVGRQRRYPEMAIRLGLEGVVAVRVRIHPDGRIAGPPVVADSSGHDLLDQEAVRMVSRAAPFPALPSSETRPTELTVPVHFRLED